MQIVIDIPKEFENHFNSDKFEDSLQRARFDIHKAIISGKDVLSGNYEIETLDMLTEAFLKGTSLPKGHGRLMILSEGKLKENQINLDSSCQKWISEVGLSNATVAIIKEESEE